MVGDGEEVFYNKNIAFCYVLNLRITFCISVLLYPLIAYMIVKHSKGMQTYKWFILFNVTSGLFFNTCFMIVSPIPLFPILGFYSENVLQTSNLHFLQAAFPLVITSAISLVNSESSMAF